MSQQIKNLPTVRETEETQVQTLGGEDPLKEERAIHSCILVWEVPCMRSLVGYSPWSCKESDTTGHVAHDLGYPTTSVALVSLFQDVTAVFSVQKPQLQALAHATSSPG